MIFQYPSFLWALSALAIPVVIHLFNFRKTVQIYFSNTRFLKQVKQETTQKRKLKQYLVLAARLLFLLFLVLAFAQPFLKATESMTSQRNISIYLDNSFSMSALVGEKTRALDAGIHRVQELVQVFPTDVRYQLLTNDFVPFSNSFKTKSEVLDFLAQIRLSSVSRSADEILKRIEERTTLFWISDFQQSTFGSTASVDSSRQIRLVPIIIGKPANVFVDSIRLENPFMIGGEKNSVKVRLRNSGNKLVEGLVVKLTVNGIQASATSVSIEPASFAELSFDLSAGQRGNNKATINFSDYPVSFDNEFYFTLNYSGKLKVVEVNATKEPTFVGKVYGNKELFAFSSFEAANLNYSLLADVDLIVVNGLDRIDPSLSTALSSYKNTGSLLFIPGTKPDLNSYQNLLTIPLKPAAEEKEMTEMARPDFQHPLFQNVFEEKSATLAMPRGKKVLDWGTDRSAILQLKDGRPYLSQFRNLFLMASPLEKSFTDFYNHALFVPIMYRMAALGKKLEQKPYYSLSSSLVTLPADSLVGEEPVKLMGSKEIVPSQRKTGNKVIIEVPRNSVSPGFYTAIHKKDTLDVLAFNLDKAESLLESFTGEQVKTRLGGDASISIFDSTTPEAFGNQIKERYLGTSLWKYALVLSLLFLLVEVLLLRFLK